MTNKFYEDYERCICVKCFESFFRRKGPQNEVCIPCKEGFKEKNKSSIEK